MAELLLELFSEEIPARMQNSVADSFRKSISEKLSKSGLYYTSVKTFITPRRLVLAVDGLSLTQEDTVVERKGPRIDAPKQAIDGFLRSTGLTMEQLAKKKLDKGEFYFAVTRQKGRPTKDVLKNIIEEAIPSIKWQKSMRWGENEIKWVRPLRNIACVFGGETLPIKFGHITSNDKSKGHRFLSSGTFNISTLSNLKDELKSRYVILDIKKRKQIITEQAENLAKEKGLTILQDESLLEEVAGLVEWPEVLMGSIEEEFMNVPEEVLISSIRTHQKYFCLRNIDGDLAPYFLIVSNMKTNDSGASIITGNERVLRARLADAKFFWNHDCKTRLEERIDALQRIIFHAKLGTIAEKTERIRKLARFLAVWIPRANLDLVERAALLCKADLTTEMVGEFPELQGIMGCYYADDEGEPEEVSLAIKEHYQPLGQNHKTPEIPVSVAVALADKIDTLCGMFAVGEKPTGSKDQYALRRAALGCIRIILENRISIPLTILFEHSLKTYPKTLFKQPDDAGNIITGRKKFIKVKPEEIINDLLEFFSERLKALLKAENVRHDLISSVFNSSHEDDLLHVVQRVAALDRLLRTDDGINLLSAYKRATNIVRIEEKNDDIKYCGNPSKALLELEEEINLFENLQNIRNDIKNALKENLLEDAMGLVSKLRTPIDLFFDNVTVNCDDRNVRKNRLKILAQIREILNEIADFSVIEG